MNLSFLPAKASPDTRHQTSTCFAKPNVIVIGAKPHGFEDDRAQWIWLGLADSFSFQDELPTAVVVLRDGYGVATKLLRDLPKCVQWNVFYDLTLSVAHREELFKRIWYRRSPRITIVTNSKLVRRVPGNICFRKAGKFVREQTNARDSDVYFFIDEDVCSLPVMQTWFAQQVPILQQYGSYFSARYIKISCMEFYEPTINQIQRFVALNTPCFCHQDAVLHFENLPSSAKPSSPVIVPIQKQLQDLEAKVVFFFLFFC